MLYLFGPPRVEASLSDLFDRQESASIQLVDSKKLDSKKPSALLIYVAATGTWVDRNYLASLLWGDSEEKKARSSVRQAVHHLRKIGWDDSFILEKTRVRLKLKTDVDLLKEKLAEQDYQAIAELAKVPFLENYSTGIEAFDQWVQLERQTLDGIWREAVLQFSRTASLEEYPEALAFLNIALERDPFSEEVVQQMLKLSMQSGLSAVQQANFRETSIKAYQKFEHALLTDLKLEPLEETKKLLTLLQQKDVSIKETKTATTRKSLTPFVGRDLELTELCNMLEQPQQKLVTILGQGGMGKTRLALQVLDAQQQNFKDGIHFVDLSIANSKEDIIYQCSQTLDLQLDASATPQEQLKEFLTSKDLLLILDNFEHLIEHAALLNDWLVTDTSLKILVTSRSKLNLQLDQVFPLEGLSFVTNTATEHFESCDAVQFFLRTAKRLDPSFFVQQEDSQYVLQICQRLEGLPLGLELTASWLPVMTLKEIATELEESLDLLDSALQDTPERQKSLKDVFEYSWQLLSASEQTTLAALSIFEEGFSQAAIRAITPAITLDTTTATPTSKSSSRKDLLTLINKSLVQRVSPGRFNLHALVKQYAASKLTTDASQNLREAHKNYFLQKLLENADKLRGSQAQEALTDIATNLRNIQLAYLAGLENLSLEKKSSASWALRRFYELRARFAEGIYFFEQAEQAVKSLVTIEKDDGTCTSAILQAEGAWLLQCRGRYLEAITLAEQSLDQASEHDTIALAALQAIGASRMRLGDFEEARGRLEQGLAIAQKLENTSVAASLGSNLGLLHQRLADYDRALDYMYASLADFRQLKDAASSTTLLNNIADVLLSLERPQEALPLLEEGITLSKEGEFWRFYPYLLFNAGRAYTMLGKAEDSLAPLEEAISYAQKNNDPYLESWVEQALAEAHSELGEFQKAEVHLLKSLQIASETNNTPLALDNLLILAKTIFDTNSDLATELLGYISNHSQVLESNKREAQALLKTLATESEHLKEKDLNYVINYASLKLAGTSKKTLESNVLDKPIVE